jgi:hypothetical protein
MDIGRRQALRHAAGSENGVFLQKNLDLTLTLRDAHRKIRGSF